MENDTKELIAEPSMRIIYRSLYSPSVLDDYGLFEYDTAKRVYGYVFRLYLIRFVIIFIYNYFFLFNCEREEGVKK